MALVAASSLGAVLLFAYAHRKYAAWELKRAHELIEQEKARAEAKKEAAERSKRVLIIAGVTVALVSVTTIFLRVRYARSTTRMTSSILPLPVAGSPLPAIAY